MIGISKLFKPKEKKSREGPMLWAPSASMEKVQSMAEKITHLYNFPVSPKALHGSGMIWAVQAPEGGDGATTVAVNIAAMLAREEPGRVVLIDLDGPGAVRSRLGMPVSQCLVNILDWQDVQGVRDMQRAMFAHSSGVMVVPGVVHYDHLSLVTPLLICRMLKILKERFTHIIIDCPPVGPNNNTWVPALLSDMLITVIKPTRSSLDLARDNYSFLKRLGCGEKTRVLLNIADMPGGISTADIIKESNAAILGFDIHHTLPFSPGLVECENKRQLVAIAKPKDNYAASIKKVIEVIAGTKGENSGNFDQDLMRQLISSNKDYRLTGIEDDDPGETKENTYTLSSVPGLKDRDYIKIRVYVQNELRRALKPEEQNNSRDPMVRSRLRAIVSRALITCDIPLGQPAVEKLVEELGNECLGYGPIEPFFYDPEVTEIIACKDKIRVERNGKLKEVESARFRSEEHIRDVLERMLAPTGRSVSPASPAANATLFDGSRLIAQIPPLANKGTMFTIRRFRNDMTVENLLNRQVITPKVLEIIRASVVARQNIIVSGGTGSGKTTFLNCIASFIPPDENIITIEDPAELQLQHPFVRSLEARPANNEGKGEITQSECVAQSLRMRPERIIVGECRKKEIIDMLQAMNTGHPGSLSTIHSDSAFDCVKRMYSLVSQYSTIPHEAVYDLLTVIDFIVQVVRERNGRRRLDHICEVVGVKRDEKTGTLTMELNTLIKYDSRKDDFVWAADKLLRKDILIEDGGWKGWH
jgi:pilus assembly protein CpaF